MSCVFFLLSYSSPCLVVHNHTHTTCRPATFCRSIFGTSFTQDIATSSMGGGREFVMNESSWLIGSLICRLRLDNAILDQNGVSTGFVWSGRSGPQPKEDPMIAPDVMNYVPVQCNWLL